MSSQQINELIKLCKFTLTIPEVNHQLIQDLTTHIHSKLSALNMSQFNSLDLNELLTYLSSIPVIKIPYIRDNVNKYLDELRDPIDFNNISKFIKIIDRIELIIYNTYVQRPLWSQVDEIIARLKAYESQLKGYSDRYNLNTYQRNRYLTEIREIVN